MITGYQLNKIKKFQRARRQALRAGYSGRGLGCFSSLAQAWRRPGGRRAAGAQALKLSSLTSPQAWDIIGLKRK